MSPSSSDLSSLFEQGDAALEAFQGDATARLVLRPIAPSQKTSGAGTSPTSSLEHPASSSAQWHRYASYGGGKDVQMAMQLQQEKEHRQAAEERANQAIELARQLAMTLAAQQGIDANGMLPSQNSSSNGGSALQQSHGQGLLPGGGVQSSASLLPQQASLPPLAVAPHGAPMHGPMRPGYPYSDYGSPHAAAAAAAAQYSQQHGLDPATAAARCAPQPPPPAPSLHAPLTAPPAARRLRDPPPAARRRFILNQSARGADPELQQLLQQQHPHHHHHQHPRGDWAGALGGMPHSHDGSPWGTPTRAGGWPRTRRRPAPPSASAALAPATALGGRGRGPRGRLAPPDARRLPPPAQATAPSTSSPGTST
jgi:hypothetical protein